MSKPTARGAKSEKRRLPIGRLTTLAVAVAAIFVLTRTGSAPRFHDISSGIEFGTLRGDPYCRRGSSDIAMLRVDPRRVRLRMRHYTQIGGHTPPTILEWFQRDHPLAVFNAGQYYPDYSYMGRFVSGGRIISRRQHSEYQAALVDDPKGGGDGARVLDLQRDSIDIDQSPWQEVAQSFMLFDADGRIRVRRSGVVANRTLVAEDHDGRLLVLTTEGGYTLYEIAGLLMHSPLKLRQAMSMDGGDEATLCVAAGDFRYASLGKWEANGQVPNPAYAIVPLPAVVEVLER